MAGPVTTEPSAIEKALPWHSQLMLPSETELTMQPWWVHTAEKHLNSPSAGWVMTTWSSGKIVPPPTSMSEVCAKASAPPVDSLADSLGLASADPEARWRAAR